MGEHSRHITEWRKARTPVLLRAVGNAGHDSTSGRARHHQYGSVHQLENLAGDGTDVGSAGSPHVGSADDEEVGGPGARLGEQKRSRIAFEVYHLGSHARTFGFGADVLQQ